MRWRSFISAPAALLALSSAHAPAQTIGLATGDPGTLYYTQAATIAPVLNEKAGIDIRIQRFSSPNIYLPVVDAGEVDFGLASVHDLLLALAGSELHGERKNENLRLVTITAPVRAAFFVKKDSPIRSLSDLKGKRVGWEFSRQQIVMKLIEAEFEAVGLKEADVIRIPVASAARGADEFAAGKTDAFFFVLGAAKVAEVDAKVGGIRAIPLPVTPEARAALEKSFPAAYVLEAKPVPRLAGIHEPTGVMAYDAAIFTHAAATEDLVYKMTKALHENAAALSSGSPTLRGFSTGTMVKGTDPIQYHPGAIELYGGTGLWPPK